MNHYQYSLNIFTLLQVQWPPYFHLLSHVIELLSKHQSIGRASTEAKERKNKVCYNIYLLLVMVLLQSFIELTSSTSCRHGCQFPLQYIITNTIVCVMAGLPVWLLWSLAVADSVPSLDWYLGQNWQAWNLKQSVLGLPRLEFQEQLVGLASVTQTRLPGQVYLDQATQLGLHRLVFKKILDAKNVGRLRSQFNTCWSKFLHKSHKI